MEFEKICRERVEFDREVVRMDNYNLHVGEMMEEKQAPPFIKREPRIHSYSTVTPKSLRSVPKSLKYTRMQ